VELKDKKIGFCITSAFGEFENIILQIKEIIKEGANILPIMSYNAYQKDTRFGKASNFIEKIEELTGNKIIHSIEGAEPIGPKNLTDVMIIAPCTGNTLAKLSLGISDTPVTLAAKSHLRNNNPLVIGLSTNDGLSGNAENIGRLLNRKNCYFVPFKQDSPITKPNSLVSDFRYIKKTLEYALDNEQIQPILLWIFWKNGEYIFLFFFI